MQASKIPLDRLKIHSKLITDFINQNENISPYIEEFASIDSLVAKAEVVKNVEFKREALYSALIKQNEQFGLSESSQKNIELLKNRNTLTICTGHQLNMFSGPAYFIYKILSTIRLAQDLDENNSVNNYVPVYWMASEDHDFEEINHTYAFSKRFEWDSGEKGKVGSMSIDSLNDQLVEFLKVLHLDEPNQTKFALEKASKEKCLADFTRVLVNELFGEYGIIVIDADDKDLKSMFVSDMQDEILQPKNEQLVNETSALLSREGYKVQVNPRAINLFYLEDQSRTRIVSSDSGFMTLDGNITWSLSEIQGEIASHPERFSPNVILRPLYQQRILPNVAYIGGPGEIAYWLQLKSMFDSNKAIFPLLVLRDQALVLNKSAQKKIDALDLTLEEIFAEQHQLENKIIKDSTDFNIESQRQQLIELVDEVGAEVLKVDQTLKGRTDLTLKNILKEIDGLESKVKKSLKQKNEVQIQKIASIKSFVFPEGSFQERRENFFALATFYDEDLKIKLLESFNPLDHSLTVIHPS